MKNVMTYYYIIRCTFVTKVRTSTNILQDCFSYFLCLSNLNLLSFEIENIDLSTSAHADKHLHIRFNFDCNKLTNCATGSIPQLVVKLSLKYDIP